MRRYFVPFLMSSLTMHLFGSLSLNAEADIAIVGAGLAGLSAAYQLQKEFGLAAQVYEASERVGGRVFTKIDEEEGVQVELGASFIDEDHEAITSLIADMGLSLVHLKTTPSTPLYLFDHLIDQRKLFEEFRPWLEHIQRDIELIAKEEIQGFSATKEKIGELTIKEYLDHMKAPPLFQRIANATQSAEYGPGIRTLNALSLLDLISIDLENKQFVMDGKLGDEGRVIKGGNSLLPTALAARLALPIKFHHRLTKVSFNTLRNKYQLYFMLDNAAPFIIEATYVILALPMPVLKNNIIIDKNLLRPETKQAIEQISTGHVSKFIMRFSKPVWQTTSDEFFELLSDDYDIWDSSFKENNNRVYHLTVYRSEPTALDDVEASPKKHEEEVLSLLEKVFPTIRTVYLGHTSSCHWPSHPLFQGAFTGALGAKEWHLSELLTHPQKGNLVFAGEQWHPNPGFMNGAIESGQWAARRVGTQQNGPF